MKLYHFTQTAFLPQIRKRGLLAYPNHNMGAGRALVALTEQPSTEIPSKDAAWFIRNGIKPNFFSREIVVAPHLRFNQNLGCFELARPTWLHTSDRRLTVKLRKGDRRLVEFRTFLRTLRKEDGDTFYDARSLPYVIKSWWVYLGDIGPDQIDNWHCTEGTALELWPRNHPDRVATFSNAGIRDTVRGRGQWAPAGQETRRLELLNR